MAEELTKDEKIEDAIVKTEFGYNKHPSPRKYKKFHPRDQDFKDEIGYGTPVIVRVNKNFRDVLGYMLCRVIDIDDNDSCWSLRSRFIVEIEAVSHDDLLPHIGRMRTVTRSENYSTWANDRRIVDVGKKEWHKYLITKENVNE